MGLLKREKETMKVQSRKREEQEVERAKIEIEQRRLKEESTLRAKEAASPVKGC